MPILLVDDNELVLGLQKQMLETYGLTVVTASNGADAIKLAAENQYEMIMLDIRMPDCDGYETAKKIREHDKYTFIMALSIDDAPDYDALAEAGINQVLIKPLELHKLRAAIDEYFTLERDDIIKWKRKTDTIFDLDELCKAIGSPHDARNIIQSFLYSHGNDGKLIMEAIENGDFDKAGTILHDIVSVSGILNCHRLYSSALRLNANIKSGSTEGLEYFRAAWLDTVNKLAYVFDRMSVEVKETYEDDNRDWETLLSDFISLSGEFDVEATEIFNRHRAEFENGMPADLFEKLERAVNTYNYLEVQKLMEAYHV